MLTRNDFLTIAIQDKEAIKKMCRDITTEVGHAMAFNRLMDIRVDIQHGLERYSKKKTDLDGIQLNAIKITRWLEIWCAEWFRFEVKKEVIRKDPTTLPEQVKRMAEHEWETYLRKRSNVAANTRLS